MILKLSLFIAQEIVLGKVWQFFSWFKNRIYSCFQILSSFRSLQLKCLRPYLWFRFLWVRITFFSDLTLYVTGCLKTMTKYWVRRYLGLIFFTDIISTLFFVPCLSVCLIHLFVHHFTLMYLSDRYSSWKLWSVTAFYCIRICSRVRATKTD